MDPEDKAILSRNRVYLKNNVFVSEDMLSYLREDKILTEELEERLMKENLTRVGRVNSLVDLLTKRGPKAFKAFLKSLICSNQEFIAQHLHPKYAQEIKDKLRNPSNNDEDLYEFTANINLETNNNPKINASFINKFSELIDIRKEKPSLCLKGPTTPTAPNASMMSNLIESPVRGSIGKNPYNFVSEDFDDEIDHEFKSDEADLKMIQEGPPLLKLGVCYDWNPQILDKHKSYTMSSMPRGVVLIFNVSVIDQFEERRGCQFDVKNLQNLFLRLGFEVVIFENQTVEEFKKTLSEKIGDENLRDLDSFIIIIMTHGSDNDVLYMTDGGKVTLDEVKKQLEGAQVLKGKPKLIFVQACRSNDEATSELKIECDARRRNNVKADVFVFLATTKGDRAARDPMRGSWFIRALVLMLSRHAHEWHYSEVMTSVQRLVSQLQADDHEQIAPKEDTSRFCFFFCPVRIRRLIEVADDIQM